MSVWGLTNKETSKDYGEANFSVESLLDGTAVPENQTEDIFQEYNGVENEDPVSGGPLLQVKEAEDVDFGNDGVEEPLFQPTSTEVGILEIHPNGHHEPVNGWVRQCAWNRERN